MTAEKKQAWICFKNVSNNFLGKHCAYNYKELVNDMLVAYKKLGCNMSLKVHILHSNMNYFLESCSDVSNGHGERFHKDIMTLECRYEGKWIPTILSDYC